MLLQIIDKQFTSITLYRRLLCEGTFKDGSDPDGPEPSLKHIRPYFPLLFFGSLIPEDFKTALIPVGILLCSFSHNMKFHIL